MTRRLRGYPPIAWAVHRERCESGRIGTLGKRVKGNLPWVRIPPSPPENLRSRHPVGSKKQNDAYCVDIAKSSRRDIHSSIGTAAQFFAVNGPVKYTTAMYEPINIRTPSARNNENSVIRTSTETNSGIADPRISSPHRTTHGQPTRHRASEPHTTVGNIIPPAAPKSGSVSRTPPPRPIFELAPPRRRKTDEIRCPTPKIGNTATTAAVPTHENST